MPQPLEVILTKSRLKIKRKEAKMDYSNKGVLERSYYELICCKDDKKDPEHLSPLQKGDKAKALIDALENKIAYKRSLIFENQEFIDEVVSCERKIRQYEQELQELLGFKK